MNSREIRNKIEKLWSDDGIHFDLKVILMDLINRIDELDRRTFGSIKLR